MRQIRIMSHRSDVPSISEQSRYSVMSKIYVITFSFFMICSLMLISGVEGLPQDCLIVINVARVQHLTSCIHQREVLSLRY